MTTARKLQGIALVPIKLIARLALLTCMAIPAALLGAVVLGLLMSLLPIEPKDDNDLRGLAIMLVTVAFAGPGFFAAALILFNQMMETNTLTRKDILRAGICGGGLIIFSYAFTRIGIVTPGLAVHLFWFVPAYLVAVAAEALKRPQVGGA